jgi:hypothetical protein
MSIKTRLDKFSRSIRPTEEHFAEATRQANYMREKLAAKVASDGSFKLVKILKAGSNAKFTSLMETDTNLFDVDLGAYYSGDGATKTELNKLLNFTCDQLQKIYPSKDKSDFEIAKSAVRVKFRTGIKLNVDVAPIITDDSLNVTNGGWIPRKDSWRLTSITCHNEFVKNRTAQSKDVSGPVKFNRLVRMVKWWNNLQGELRQPSIFCDLITAKAFEEVGVTTEWQSSLLHAFSFFRKHQFLEPIIFNDYYDSSEVDVSDHTEIIVMDSVNPENNITWFWTEDTRLEYLERIQTAYDAIVQARSCELDGEEDEAVDEWCEVFGEDFRELSEEY